MMSEMNSSVCRYPLLSKALLFPPNSEQWSESRKPQPALKPQKTSGYQMCFTVLGLFFQMVSLVGKPIELLTGGTYAYDPVILELL